MDRTFRSFKKIPSIFRTSIIVVGVIFLTVPAASATDIWAATIAPHGNPTVAVKMGGVQLKEACKNRKPDLVLLFDYRSVVRTAEDKMTIVNGLAESFDRNCIYGATVHGYMKDNTSHGENIGVIALVGIKVTPVKDGVTAPLMTIMDDLEIGHPATGEPAVAKEDQFSVCVISGKK